jgi:hypothetical protein
MAREGVDFRGRLVADAGRAVTFADGTATEVDARVGHRVQARLHLDRCRHHHH